MTYLYQKYSGNKAWAKPYITTLQKYADYLVQNGLYPIAQQSSVDAIGATANQTILVIQSAIGINAFGALTGQANYTAVANSYASIIENVGQDSEHTHFLTHYGSADSEWVTTYPFAFDQLLDLHTFNAVWTNGINRFTAPTQWNVVGAKLGVGVNTRAKPIVGSIFMIAALNST